MVCHAAGESTPERVPPGTHAVILAASADALLDLETRLERSGVPHAAIRESDAPYAGQLLAIGLAPAPRALVRRVVSSFPLLREKEGPTIVR